LLDANGITEEEDVMILTFKYRVKDRSARKTFAAPRICANQSLELVRCTATPEPRRAIGLAPKRKMGSVSICEAMQRRWQGPWLHQQSVAGRLRAIRPHGTRPSVFPVSAPRRAKRVSDGAIPEASRQY